ncbi:MAG: autotransporter outer membrane beta-barrel domain-containing protein, partial [Chitinophagaceae bacterium]
MVLFFLTGFIFIKGYCQTNNYFGTSGTLSGNVWSTNPAGPYTSAFNTTGGGIMNFGNTVTSITGASITVAGINATASVSSWTAGGTISNLSNGVITVNVSGNNYLDMGGTQSFTSSATAGYIKSGTGIWGMAGNTYGGGFTLSEGTIVARGNNAFGSGLVTLNGGVIASAAARNFTSPTSIVVGGNIQFGEIMANISNLLNNSNTLTFADNISLGSSNRTFTVGNQGLHTFSGIISGNSGVGLDFNSNGNSGTTGGFTLSGANTYSGTTSVSGIQLNISTVDALGATSAGTTINSGASLRLSFSGGNQTYNAEPLTINGAGIGTSVGALRHVTNTILTYSGAITLGSAASIQSAGGGTLITTGGINGSYDLTIGGASSISVNTIGISQITSLTKDGAGTLTLTAQNTYTGLTTVSAGTLRLN